MSFDIDQVTELEPPLEWELSFVASMARSGLNDAQITELLSTLEQPYRYKSDSIAFSFEYGWVCPPPEKEPFDVIEDAIDHWLESLAEEGQTQRLAALQHQIVELLAGSESEEE